MTPDGMGQRDDTPSAMEVAMSGLARTVETTIQLQRQQGEKYDRELTRLRDYIEEKFTALHAVVEQRYNVITQRKLPWEAISVFVTIIGLLGAIIYLPIRNMQDFQSQKEAELRGAMFADQRRDEARTYEKLDDLETEVAKKIETRRDGERDAGIARMDRIQESLADSRNEVTALTTKLREIETQFRASGKMLNLFFAYQNQLNGLVWQKAYGADLPALVPTIDFDISQD